MSIPLRFGRPIQCVVEISEDATRSIEETGFTPINIKFMCDLAESKGIRINSERKLIRRGTDESYRFRPTDRKDIHYGLPVVELWKVHRDLVKYTQDGYLKSLPGQG